MSKIIQSTEVPLHLQIPEEQQIQEEEQLQQPDIDLVGELVVAGSWIVQHPEFLSDVGTWWSQMVGGVTNVRSWVNETDQEVQVWKLDGGYWWKDHYTIPAMQTIDADMWIPWVDNPYQYRTHHATIQVGGKVLAHFWQSGRLIRFNVSDTFVYGAPGVPGASGAGGTRTMIMASDPQSRTGFALGTFKP